MIDTYQQLSLVKDPNIKDKIYYSEKYLIRSLDTLPTILSPEEIEERLDS